MLHWYQTLRLSLLKEQQIDEDWIVEYIRWSVYTSRDHTVNIKQQIYLIFRKNKSSIVEVDSAVAGVLISSLQMVDAMQHLVT